MNPIDKNRRNRSLRRKERKQRYGARGPETHIRPPMEPRPPSAYPAPIDAVVLAGNDANPKRMIAGRNKALLDLGGRTLVRTVVEALLEASNVDRVFVVGPLESLEKQFADLSSRVRVVAQVGKMLPNAWAGVQASQRLRAADGQCTSGSNPPILLLSCDLPLISGEAVDDFVARCALKDERLDGAPQSLLVGVVEEASVVPFYPKNGLPGIIRPFVELRSGRFRLANIYVVRPGKQRYQVFQTGFSFRKAQDWRNVLALAWSVFTRPRGWRIAWLILRFHATQIAAKRKGRLYRALRRGNSQDEIETLGSVLLECPFRLIETPFGGLSLDVDDEEDYLVLGQRFAEWSSERHQKSNAKLA